MLAYALAAAVVALLAAAQLGLLAGRQPSDLGVTQGRLKAPSATPNSVSSQAHLYPEHPQRAYSAIEPLPLKGGDPQASIRSLIDLLSSVPGVTVVERRPDYVYATAQTRWLRFVDDMEFWVNPERQVIELRSASRLGRKDFGANRQRMDGLRAAYLAQPGISP